MKQFLVQYRRFFNSAALLLVLAAVTSVLAGCGAPTWLTDAQGIVALVGTSITSIGSFIAALSGNAALAAGLAVVTDWINKVETGITDLEELVSQYSAAPTASLLQEIEAALAAVEGNIQRDFSNLGLPTSLLAVIAGVAALALSQLEAWGSLIPAAKATAGQVLTVRVPYTKAEYKALVNKILETPTGDVEIDAALAKAKKL